MQRRHFIKLSVATTAAVLYSRLTYAGTHDEGLMNTPDEIWVQSGTYWFKLVPSGDSYTSHGITVSLKTVGNALSVYAQSPVLQLNTVSLRWKHTIVPNTKFLGDHWERSYGDLAWKKDYNGVKNPWYVILHDDNQTACFGVKTGGNSISSWQLKPESIELNCDTTSGGMGVLLGDRMLHTADVITTNGKGSENPYATATRFCSMMCEKPRLPKLPVYGINDWYFAYGNNSADLIRKTTNIMAGFVTSTNNRPFSVVDAGWAKYAPDLPGDGGWQDDFAQANDKFKDMHLLADDIKKAGMRPGLWVRPLCGRHDDNANLLSPKIPGRKDPKNPTLDPTIPENIERIKNYMQTYVKWGYDLVKHDYTTYDIFGRWGMDMVDEMTTGGWRFNDPSKTNAEIILNLYKAIRESAGDMYIIGCNTMSHLSAGLFELNRIGDDTSGKEWSRTRKMGVNTLGFRLPQHNTFYAADGDCVGLTTDIPWQENKQWLQLLSESGAPLFISAQPQALGNAQRNAVKQAFANAAKVQPTGEPLDWMATKTPSKWKLNNRVVDFDWS